MRKNSKHSLLKARNINPVIRLLIFSDILIIGATAMLAPIFALFVEDYILGADEIVVSVAMGIFLVSRSIFQIPVATIIDKIKGEGDDFYFMVVSSFLSAVGVLLYLPVTEAWQLYAVQLLLGLLSAITYPSYMAIFTRHIDKNREGTEWAIYYTLTDLSSAFLVVIGGVIASQYGFQTLIIVTSIISLVGAVFLIPIKKGLR